MIYIVILITLSFLVYNILNEAVVLEFFNTRNLALIPQWHLYDAIFRAVFFPIIVFSLMGFTFIAFKVIICIGIFYHFGFNMLLNYWRRRKEWKLFPFKEKIQILLYLSEGSIIDNAIIKFAYWLSIQLSKLFKRKVKVDYRNINAITISIEIAIIILICLWN